MSKVKFYDFYNNRPPKNHFKPDTETVFVSQSEIETSGLKYQLSMYGFDSLAQRMEDMRSKFGYADCTKISDFRESMNKYSQGVEYFNALPSEIRRKYNDRPELFYDECFKNPDTAYEAGFISEDYYKEIKSKNNSDSIEVTSSPKEESSSQPSEPQSV